MQKNKPAPAFAHHRHVQLLGILVAATIALCAACSNGGNSLSAEQVSAIQSVAVPRLRNTTRVGDALTTATTRPVTPTTVQQPPPKPWTTFEAALFDTNSAQLRPDAIARCDAAAQQLRGVTDRRIVVVGFADTRPTKYRGGNPQLSLDRATNVSNCLSVRTASAGLRFDYSTFGLGVQCPKTPNPLDEENRRVEVYCVRADAPALVACGPRSVSLGT